MRIPGLICVAAVLLSCNNDKMVDNPNQSQFFFVRVDPQAATLAQGGTQKLTVTAFDASCTGTSCNPLAPGNPISVNGIPTFRSTDVTVATVDANGLVTAQGKAGTANIIGTLQDIPGGSSVPSVTFADTTPVTVLGTGVAAPAIGGMTLTSSRSTNGAGSNDTLTVTYTDAGGATIATQRATTNTSGFGRPAFFVSDPSIATVGATGIVTGVKPGTTTITAANNIGGVTKTATFPITITDPITATVSITTATSGTGIIFFPGTITVSATEAAVEGRPNTTTPGAVVTWSVVGTTLFPNTFRPVAGLTPPDTVKTTPNSTDCFNVTFANPAVALAATPTGKSGNIGTGGPGSTDPPLCNGNAQQRLFVTPGTYTYKSTTPGSNASGTLVVK